MARRRQSGWSAARSSYTAPLWYFPFYLCFVFCALRANNKTHLICCSFFARRAKNEQQKQLFAFKPTLQLLKQQPFVKRLGQVVITSGRPSFFGIAAHGMCSQGDDRNV